MTTPTPKEDCCAPRVAQKQTVRRSCPSCGHAGKPVKPITIDSLVLENVRARLGDSSGFLFCKEPSCSVAYYKPASGQRILSSEVNVRIGQKVTDPPRPVCYCFDHTIEDLEGEVRATGTSTIPDSIGEKCKQGLDRCEETNPQGSCCLGNVRAAVKACQQSLSTNSVSVEGRSDR